MQEVGARAWGVHAAASAGELGFPLRGWPGPSSCCVLGEGFTSKARSVLRLCKFIGTKLGFWGQVEEIKTRNKSEVGFHWAHWTWPAMD